MGKRSYNVLFSDAEIFEIWRRFQDLIDEARESTGEPICRQDPELYYMEGNDQHAAYSRSYARKQCFSCPLQDPCATYAIIANEPDGIWGGLGPTDRKNWRRKLNEPRKMAVFAKEGFFAYRRTGL